MSKILGIPDTTIHYRMKKLNDIIKKYTILLDYEKIGLDIYLLSIEIEKYVLNKITKEVVENIYNDLSKKKESSVSLDQRRIYLLSWHLRILK